MVGYRAEDETGELDFEKRRRGDRNSEDCLPISLTGFSGWCEFFFPLNLLLCTPSPSLQTFLSNTR